MRNDVILAALINFLVPMILLYASFSLVDCFTNGFFSIIYSITLFTQAFMIYSVRFDSLKLSTIISINIISWIGLAFLMLYLAFILLLLLGIF